MNRTLTIVLVTALALITAQVAWSAIPASNGKITGCYNTTDGALRVVSLGTSCDSSTEKSIQWSQGPERLNQDVAEVDVNDQQSPVQIYAKHGMKISYVCEFSHGDAAWEVALLVDPGTSGTVNAGYSLDDGSGNTPTPQQAGAAGSLSIGANLPSLFSRPFMRLEGTAIVQTTTNVISLAYHIVQNINTARCQFVGTITAA